MKWKRGPTDFLSEKTFLIIRDDMEILKGKGSPKSPVSLGRRSPRTKVKTDTWPPKMKRARPLMEDMERPRTANLEKPSVLDPNLVDKLDMSLLSKELLCDSMTRFQLAKTISGGTSPFSPRRRRQSVAVHELSRQQKYSPAAQNTWISGPFSVRHKQPNFEQINDTRLYQSDAKSLESPRMEKQARIASQDANTWKKQNSDGKKLDDNNNRNGNPGTNKITSLSMVKKKGSRTTITSDLEVFTGSATTRLAPEPCKTCGRSDQPERFHSHPKGVPSKPKDTTSHNTKPKIAIPKSIQKPVALNFRSDKNRNKLEEHVEESKVNSTRARDDFQNDPQESYPRGNRALSASMKKGPKTVTCYICGREFGTASFPIHEPRCMQKWERENNLLPVSQRRPVPQRPTIEINRTEWNDAAWQESQAQLLPCSKCGRTFLPERLPIHERSCKATPKNADSIRSDKTDVSEKRLVHLTQSGPATVACQICGRNFGSRSIKIHEPQCMKKSQMEKKDSVQKQKHGSTSAQDFSPSSNSTAEPPQKRTVTCYICGRDFGSISIGIHEPQCLKKWQLENDKLPPNQRRPVPQKPDVIYVYDERTGNATVDSAAMAEASWKSHLQQLVPCKRCGRTFNPDRVDIHERSCKGMR